MDMGVSDPGERLWPALSSSDHGRCGQSSRTRIPGGKNRREMMAGLQSIDGPQLRVGSGGGARVQFVPGGHAVIGARQPRRFLAADHAGRPAKVRAFQEPAYQAELLAVTQLAARVLVLACWNVTDRASRPRG
jgi:hypothetical protein